MNGKTLTAEQCSKLSLYILMTTKTREGEAEAWEKLALSRNGRFMIATGIARKARKYERRGLFTHL